MAGTFTRIPTNTFNDLQTDAGILLWTFTPSKPLPLDETKIICATTGGISISCVPQFSDMGEDVDNCPNGMAELMQIDQYECKMSFNCIGITEDTIRMTLGASTTGTNGKISPSKNLAIGHFKDIWWVGDKKDGGVVAVHLKTALATSGFALTTTKNGKGQLAVELAGHVSINAQDDVPMDIYLLDAPLDTSSEGGEDYPVETEEE